ncbi:MAG: M28 family metallopeptidase [Acidobacteriia bacterium]|nr:M28 family metallopeptidase [Terriglobia bacterium]
MRFHNRFVLVALLCATLFAQAPPQMPAERSEREIEQQFLSVPDPRQAEQHMKILTAEPHIAGSPEDRKTADYVARKFREWGFDTEIVEYKVWMNYPAEVSVDAFTPAGAVMHGPTREHVEGDPFQDDPRIVIPFNAFSPSGDVEGEVVYANYGRPEDFQKLKEMGVNVRGKVVLARYGENFRGVKAYMAQETGAAAMLIYSDPMDDGYFRGDVYPKGPWRPDTGVQRGTIEYGFEHPGDPTTPGWPSTADARRVSPQDSPDIPKIPTTPLSYHDAAPILQHLGGVETPRELQGALPFTYHLGPGPPRVRLHLKQDFGYRAIWDVIARVRGTRWPDEWVVAGAHRDAWVYGAVDPISGTTAMLEAARGVGHLLQSGWRPQRTIIFASWDAEEQGLIGSTEWLEQNEKELESAAAYFNLDTGASGPNFRASAVPSLRGFLRDITKSVPSPQGGTLYDAWRTAARRENSPKANPPAEPQVGNLGSGSDFTSFLDHSGVPATDIRSSGNYGVYHSVFDNFAWYKKFADTDFLYTQEIARVYGLQVLRMAEAGVLPYDYEEYGKEIGNYLDAAQKTAGEHLGDKAPKFDSALAAARRLAQAGAAIRALSVAPSLSLPGLERQGGDYERLNKLLLATERALLLPGGLPRRPWFRHAIYAPADLKGYSASTIPGVSEAIRRNDAATAAQQLQALTDVLNRAAVLLEGFKPASAN